MNTELALPISPSLPAPITGAVFSYPQFVHLRMHSEYSIVDGLVRIDDVVKAAVKDKQAALALLWIAAILTMITGWDYLRVGIKHMD